MNLGDSMSRFFRGISVNFLTVLIIFSAYSEGSLVQAQGDTVVWSREADSVYITAARIVSEALKTPFSVTTIGPEFIAKGKQRLSLKESLDYIPGVISMNAENYTQDLRISIRGFGARAAFGIRGIKILVDGVPETTPDGQGQLDNLDLNVINRIEVLRAPVSGLYGNAAGGVISMRTLPDTRGNEIELFSAVGSYGFRNLHFKVAGQKGKWTTGLAATHIRTDGYRMWSGMENNIWNASVSFKPDSIHRLTLLLNYANSPWASDAGGLTLDESNANRRAANPQNQRFAAGERVSQSKIALRWLTQNQQLSSEVNTWYIYRDFENALPFRNGGIVSLKRNFPGINALVHYISSPGGIPVSLTMGVDAEFQHDERLRYDNLEGIRGQIEVFRQEEIFNNQGVFLAGKISPFSALEAGFSVRKDLIYIKAIPFDKPEQKIYYRAWNPAFSLNYRIGKGLYAYANYTTGFESPALTELSNNPEGGKGLNGALQPQTTKSAETGLKWKKNARLEASFCGYRIWVQNEILPYELPAFPQRLFYRNAGNTLRNGIEANVNYALSAHFRIFASYTLSDFRYERYPAGAWDFAGNRPPGQPLHHLFADFRYEQQSGAYFILNFRYQGALFAEDANTVEIADFTVLNVKAGKEWQFSGFRIEPCIGIQNVLNSLYFSNIRINAAAGRYYEPAQERNIFVSLKFQITDQYEATAQKLF